MKYFIRWGLIICALMLIPGICTLIMTKKTGNMQKKMGITVTMEDGSKIDGEEYVMGMAATMSSYIQEKEAWNAWMIVCRTNFMKAAGDKKQVKEKDLELDYLSKEDLEKNNGRKTYVELIYRLEQSSADTFGKTIQYDGQPIDALYHEISIGKTVSSKEIYGVEVPYLVSVDSSQDVEADGYMTVKILSYEECAKKLKKEGDTVSKADCKKLKIQEQTESGYVKTVKTGDQEWKGETWQEIFDLPSSNFYLEDYGGKLRIVCLGKGHGMGMSLYGANSLAQRHMDARMILSYYYPGTKTDV